MIRLRNPYGWAAVGLLGVLGISLAAPGIIDPIPIVEPGVDSPPEQPDDAELLAEYGIAAQPEPTGGPTVPAGVLSIGAWFVVIAVLGILASIGIAAIRDQRSIPLARFLSIGGLGLLIVSGLVIGLWARDILAPGSVATPFSVGIAVLGIGLVGLGLVYAIRTSSVRHGPSSVGPDPTDPDPMLGVSGRNHDEDGTGGWPSATENGVYEAWAKLCDRVGNGTDGPRTPRRVKRAAMDAGLDPTTVTELTTLFESIRYSPRLPTSADEDRAMTLVEQLEDDDR